MESKEKMEFLKRAINQLIEEEQNESLVAVDDNDDDGHHLALLSKLLSQLDSLKDDGNCKQLNEEPVVTNELHPSEIIEKTAMIPNEVGSCSSASIENEQIIKELKEVKKQNSITHRLLSVMIMLTLAWQLSEVSLILKLKGGLSNPIKSIGSMFKGMLKGPAINGEQIMKDAEKKQKEFIQGYSLPGVKVPELPHVFSSEDE